MDFAGDGPDFVGELVDMIADRSIRFPSLPACFATTTVLCVVGGGDVFVCNGHLTEHVFWGAGGVCLFEDCCAQCIILAVDAAIAGTARATG